MGDQWGWWAIHGEQLMGALQRCADGDDPGIVYTELFANSRTDEVAATEPDEGGVRRDAMHIVIAWDNERGSLPHDDRAGFDHDTLERLYALLVGGAAEAES